MNCVSYDWRSSNIYTLNKIKWQLNCHTQQNEICANTRRSDTFANMSKDLVMHAGKHLNSL